MNFYKSITKASLLICALIFSTNIFAAESPETQQNVNEVFSGPQIAYVAVQPDFVTNVAGVDGRGRLHYVRISVSLMLKDSTDINLVTKSLPSIRDVIITILGSKDFKIVSSPAGREAIRAECREKIFEIINDKNGKDIIQDVLFLNYIYQ